MKNDMYVTDWIIVLLVLGVECRNFWEFLRHSTKVDDKPLASITSCFQRLPMLISFISYYVVYGRIFIFHNATRVGAKNGYGTSGAPRC